MRRFTVSVEVEVGFSGVALRSGDLGLYPIHTTRHDAIKLSRRIWRCELSLRQFEEHVRSTVQFTPPARTPFRQLHFTTKCDSKKQNRNRT